ncbi:hypothetical protein LCGC14_1921570, partial [marine sediment metagenome]
NPGEDVARRPYLDIDGFKPDKNINLSNDQCNIICIAFNEACRNLFGEAETYKAIKSDKTNNIHLVFDRYIQTANEERSAPYAYQKILIGEIKSYIKCFYDETDRQKDDDYYKMLNAIDSSPGLRSLYSLKNGDKNNYYVPSQADACSAKNVETILKHDPCFISNSRKAEIDLSYHIEASLIALNDNNRRSQLHSSDDYPDSCDQIITMKDIKKTIKKIPIKFLTNYYSWLNVASCIKSVMYDGFNKNIYECFDQRSRLAPSYDKTNNKKLFDDARILYGGFASLIEKINKYNQRPVRADRIKSMIKNVRTDDNHGWTKMNVLSNGYIDKTFMNSIRGDIALKAHTGTGKSTACVNFIKNNPTMSVLVITQRILCGRNFLKTLNKENLGFKFYQDIDFKKINKITRLVIQIESIHKINRISDKFDLIILDEFESVVNQFDSQNFKLPWESGLVLTRIFSRANRLILMDAYLNNRTINNFYKFFRKSELKNLNKIYVDKKNKLNEEMVIFINKNNMIEQLVNDAKVGKKLVIACDMKKITYIIASLLRELPSNNKVLVINGDNSKESAQLEVINNEEKLTDYDHFIYSPSIESGFSFSKAHFDRQYNIFEYSPVSLISNLQQTNRIRVKNDKMNFVYFNKFTK